MEAEGESPLFQKSRTPIAEGRPAGQAGVMRAPDESPLASGPARRSASQPSPMDLPITVPAMLFPAVSLLYLSYNGRFLALAQLVRTLQREHREHHDPVALAQIASLRRRLGLIVWMQVAGALSFVAAAVSATAVFYGAPTLGQLAFGGALLLLIVSVLILLAEVIISTRALSLLLAQSEEATGRPTAR